MPKFIGTYIYIYLLYIVLYKFQMKRNPDLNRLIFLKSVL